MSRPPQYGNGAYGANSAGDATGAYGVHGAYPEGGRPPVPPNVYVPQDVPPPAYDGYADPATAHGWQNAYDETQKLPPVTDGESGESGEDREDREDGLTVEEGGGFASDRHRRTSGRRARHRQSPWRSRRVAVAAGAVGAVSAAALIAGISFSGSPSGGTQGKGDRTSPAAGDSETPATTAPVSSPGAAAVGRPSDSEPSSAPSSTGASLSPSASGGDGKSSRSPAESPTRTTPTPTPATSIPATSTPAGSGPGNSDGNPGRGQGGTKRPK